MWPRERGPKARDALSGSESRSHFDHYRFGGIGVESRGPTAGCGKYAGERSARAGGASAAAEAEPVRDAEDARFEVQGEFPAQGVELLDQDLLVIAQVVLGRFGTLFQGQVLGLDRELGALDRDIVAVDGQGVDAIA